MKPEYAKYRDLRLLTFELIDGSITQERMAIFNHILRSNSDAIDYYVNFLDIQMLTKSCMSSSSFKESLLCLTSDESDDLQGFWKELNEFDPADTQACDLKLALESNVSMRGVDVDKLNIDIDGNASEEKGFTQFELELLELERTSPAVEIEKPVESARVIRKVGESTFKLFPGRPSRHMIRTLLSMAACIAVLVGYLFFFAPNSSEQPVVATLTDSINAEWDSSFQVPDEFGDMVSRRYRLKSGFVNVLFSDGASVAVEAPAELSLLSADSMELFGGRIYATVPNRAHGFSVKANGSKILDLGTEFGVEVDSSKSVQVHVTKGKVLLFASSARGSKQQIEVSAGSAKEVNTAGFVRGIKLVEEHFVRNVDSAKDIISKGRVEVSNASNFKRVPGVFDNKRWARRGVYFYTTKESDAKQGLTASLYEGAYDSGVDYDSVTAKASLFYEFGNKYTSVDTPGFPILSESGEVIRPEGYYPKHLVENQTYVLRGYIEFGTSGKREVRCGHDTSSYNKVEIDGRQVYSRDKDTGKPVFEAVDLKAGKRYPVKITFFGEGGPDFWVCEIE
jgi:hypothetical protein